MEVLRNNWDSESETYDGKDECNKTKEFERTIVLKECSDHCDYLNAVANCVELGLGACGSIAILHRHIFYAPAVVDGMNGELGFDLEAFTQDGEGLYERLAHGSVAGHDVVEAIAVNPLDHGANKIVSEPVKCSFVLFCIGAIRETIADGHVCLAIKDGLTERFGGFGGVRVVSINHQVALGVDIAKHLAADVAFALPWFMSHCGPVLLGYLCRIVGGIVVVNVYLLASE